MFQTHFLVFGPIRHLAFLGAVADTLARAAFEIRSHIFPNRTPLESARKASGQFRVITESVACHKCGMLLNGLDIAGRSWCGDKGCSLWNARSKNGMKIRLVGTRRRIHQSFLGPLFVTKGVFEMLDVWSTEICNNLFGPWFRGFETGSEQREHKGWAPSDCSSECE